MTSMLLNVTSQNPL